MGAESAANNLPQLDETYIVNLFLTAKNLLLGWLIAKISIRLTVHDGTQQMKEYEPLQHGANST